MPRTINLVVAVICGFVAVLMAARAVVADRPGMALSAFVLNAAACAFNLAIIYN